MCGWWALLCGRFFNSAANSSKSVYEVCLSVCLSVGVCVCVSICGVYVYLMSVHSPHTCICVYMRVFDECYTPYTCTYVYVMSGYTPWFRV
jgi:hypothetical protein